MFYVDYKKKTTMIIAVCRFWVSSPAGLEQNLLLLQGSTAHPPYFVSSFSSKVSLTLLRNLYTP